MTLKALITSIVTLTLQEHQILKNLATALCDRFVFYFSMQLFFSCSLVTHKKMIFFLHRNLSGSIKNQVTVIFLSNYRTWFCFPCLQINRVILFRQSDPIHGCSEWFCEHGRLKWRFLAKNEYFLTKVPWDGRSKKTKTRCASTWTSNTETDILGERLW